MADDDKKDEQELSEDEKLAAEWESAMEAQVDADEDGREDEWAAAMAEAGETDDDDGSDDAKDNVRAAPMEEFPEGSNFSQGTGPAPDLDVILDIPVTISMEVGNTQIPIRNLLQLNQGSVIELDRLAGDPLELLVNATRIAQGEVVMVHE